MIDSPGSSQGSKKKGRRLETDLETFKHTPHLPPWQAILTFILFGDISNLFRDFLFELAISVKKKKELAISLNEFSISLNKLE